MKYKIEIYSLGYSDASVIVDRKPTKTDVLIAKVEWCKQNDIDEDNIELPFTRITKLP